LANLEFRNSFECVFSDFQIAETWPLKGLSIDDADLTELLYVDTLFFCSRLP